MTLSLDFARAKVARAWRLGLWWLALLPGVLQAHPHAWIDFSVRLIVDDQGRLEALHQAWRMDPFYSLILLEELSQAEGGLEAGLDQLGAEILANLEPQGYFTEARLGDQLLNLGEVSEYTVMERGGRVEFVFLLPLDTPQPLRQRTLEYRIFDPSYYLEMVHEAEGDTPRDDALRVNGELACTTRIEPADPDPERVMAASMLDVNDEAEPGLGRHFAETGVVTCD
ncbi:DUF1007 family protein [Billgrantia saliphila]|uniref:DUF1007 family protein n=1 Tax=Billgrantia saliphila TaxID=1848458 RepID=UPI000CE40D6E|nr:DUF1007 family protein [Halomonas saliphila]